MENTNTVDKVYLALELTKIRYDDIPNKKTVEVYNVFEYYLEKLTKIDDISELISELENLKKENIRLQELYNSIKKKLNDVVPRSKRDEIMDILYENKGDIEPRVYQLLVNNLKTW